MANSTQNSQADYIKLAADIVAAYVSANSVPAGSLTDLLSSVHAAISSLTNGGSRAVSDRLESTGVSGAAQM
ncbi:MucR family transcriptional regulator [Methylobacterium sp. CM6241]